MYTKVLNMTAKVFTRVEVALGINYEVIFRTNLHCITKALILWHNLIGAASLLKNLGM